MNTQDVLIQLLVGGLLGIVGQGLRVVVGMKKLNDNANQLQVKVSTLIEPSRLFVSLLIGFCAGVLSMVAISTFKVDFFTSSNIKDSILALIGAGYSGTDFIEGLIKKHLPAPVNGQAEFFRKQNLGFSNKYISVRTTDVGRMDWLAIQTEDTQENLDKNLEYVVGVDNHFVKNKNGIADKQIDSNVEISEKTTQIKTTVNRYQITV